MTSYDSFLPWVLTNVPGVPEVAAIQGLRDASIQFCEQTLIHQVDHDPVTVIANTVDYDLETPVSGTRVHKIMRAWFQGSELRPEAPDQVNSPSIYNQNIGGVTTNKTKPQTFIQKDWATFSVFPIPDQTYPNSVTLRIALAPLRSATSCEDFLYQNWGEAIAHGASARLLAMPGKSWSNPNAAAYHQTQYQIGINQARQQATHGYVRANLQVRMRRV